MGLRSTSSCFFPFYVHRKRVGQYYKWLLDVEVMIFVGFGFLMTFLRRYGYSAAGYNFFTSALIMLEAVLLIGAVQQVGEETAVHSAYTWGPRGGGEQDTTSSPPRSSCCRQCCSLAQCSRWGSSHVLFCQVFFWGGGVGCHGGMRWGMTQQDKTVLVALTMLEAVLLIGAVQQVGAVASFVILGGPWI